VKFSIAGRPIGLDHPPYVIAELSANHNGSLERALRTMEAAHRCGAGAVKLQTYTPDTMTIDCDTPDFLMGSGPWRGYKLYDLYKVAQTPFEWHQVMFEHGRKLGVTVFSTPFDETAVDLLEHLDAPAYKIASFEVTDLPLIRYVAATKKPIIMSTGLASEYEIEEAITAARDAGCSELLVMHCVSSYPAPIDQANLRQIPELAKRFGVATGLSDHTLGTAASVAAIALGAVAIEKHFTLSRADKGPDSDFSIEPHELERLCRDTKDVWYSLGRAGYARPKAEDESTIFRRSIYFVRDLPAGAIVGHNDIRRIRPGMGLAPKYFEYLIGKRLKVAVTRGTATGRAQFEDWIEN
jgi:pseudaminic acid synthase